MTDALDSLMSTGAPSAKFPTVGTIVKGEIVRVDEQQQQDYKTGALKTWDDGSPMMQHVITLRTDERDPEVPNDDGERRVFAKGLMQKAITQAIRDSGANKTQIIGGILAVQYSGDGEPSKPGFNPPKLYVAQFQPAQLGGAANLITEPVTPAPAQAAAPAPQPAQPAAPVQPTATSLI